MKYTFITSLEHRTLIKLATALWNTADVRDSISRFNFPLLLNTGGIEWHQKIENKVVEKVSKLPSAKPLKEKLLCFIRPVGYQIQAWVDFHDRGHSFVKKLPRQFIWTAQGTIDKVKTAEPLVNDESLGIYERYKLACIYCFEDCIHALWKQLLKEPYKEENANIRMDESLLISFWSHYLEGKIAQLDEIMIAYSGNDNVTPYEYAFKVSALSANEAATRYYFQKLTPEEKEKILVKTAVSVAYKRWYSVCRHADFPNECYTDVLCFLLSQMAEGQQKELFKSDAYRVLKCFIDWPWQIFFLEMAERMWDFLSGNEYYGLLSDIFDEVRKEHKDFFNYKELFGEFWQRSPRTHKKDIVNSNGLLLSHLFYVGYEESIKLIVKDLLAAERENLIFGICGKIFCLDLIFYGKWDLLKFCFRMCLSSKDVIIKFKKEFKDFMRDYSKNPLILKIEKDMRNKFFRLLNDSIEKAEERESVVEGNSSPAKRFFSLTSEQLNNSK